MIFFEVIATASRPETISWCKKNGAEQIIDHKKELKPQLDQLGYKDGVDFIFCATEPHYSAKEWPEILKPFGKAVVITGKIEDTQPFIGKSLSIIYEAMFAKTRFNLHQESQGQILHQVSELIEKGVLHHTKNYEFPFEQVAKAQDLQDSGNVIGKIVLTF